MSIARGAEGFRQFSKGDLIRVTALATRKQYAAEQALKAMRRRSWAFVVLVILLAFAVGAGSAWWVFGRG